MEIAMLGLGRMGKNMALLLNKKGHNVIAWNRGEGPRREVAEQGVRTASSIAEAINAIHASPKIVWTMLPAGEVTDSVIEEVISLLQPGDILINGANNHFKRTLYHYTRVSAKGVKFLDAGVSGGVLAIELGGYCVMFGGDEDAFTHCKPIFQDLCVDNGFDYFGPAGSGHYVKMVHNGIEYAHMAAIGEGMNLLKNGRFKDQINLEKVAKVWDNGSILAGTLMWASHRALQNDPGLEDIAPFIADTGEGKWTVQEALEQGIPFTSGAFALFERYSSRDDVHFAYRMVSAQRNAFGGHAVVKKN
jgi:6-phosphogluconate dehydrogenase